MAQIKLKLNDAEFKRQLDQLKKTTNNAVFANQLKQSLYVARKQLVSEIKSTFNETGQSGWSKEYGKMSESVMQTRNDEVEKTLHGNVNIMSSDAARTRWLEQGSYKSNPRRTKGSGGKFPQRGTKRIKYAKPRYKQDKSTGRLPAFRFVERQGEKQSSRIYSTYKQVLEKEINKLNN